jgi:acetyl esterase/lipase
MADDPEEILTRSAPDPDFIRAYGTDANQVIDMYMPPPGTENRGLVAFVHGGFWRALYDRTHTRPLAAALASDGYVVANVEYRRVGHDGGGWPGTLTDVVDAVSALPDIVGDGFGKPILGGHSAGGHLALWAAHRLGPDEVGGVLALSPAVDLVRMQDTGIGGGAVADLLDGEPDAFPDRYGQADPYKNLPIGVPMVVVHGRLDEVVPFEFGSDFAAEAEAAGDEVRLVELPDIAHYALIDPLSSAWPAVREGLASLTTRARG